MSINYKLNNTSLNWGENIMTHVYCLTKDIYNENSILENECGVRKGAIVLMSPLGFEVERRLLEHLSKGERSGFK
ncbi:MAG: hypothetical protein H0U49_04460 [Parachlamydiaceae bacterium]|nr:hypothetical protein [Parachlamydiaceae bacterium]